MSNGKKILLIDDERYFMAPYIEFLKDEGFSVLTAGSLGDGKKLINANPDADAAIVDIMMPVGDDPDPGSEFETRMGFMSGLVLARWIKANHLTISIIGMSLARENEITTWFERNGAGFLDKTELLLHDFTEEVKRIVNKEDRRKHLRVFIVHGHDEVSKYELKNYLQNTLRLPEPVILHEQPSLGRTILEKFEQETRNVNLVFVLLTPDDDPFPSPKSNDAKRRARQNVVFEMGYFFGKLQRKNGRIVLLYKGSLELPTDISGIIYVDISKGIESAGELIRKELSFIFE